MGAYSFTPTFVNGGIPPGLAAKETPPSSTIAATGQVRLGALEAGGGGATDFWRIKLVGGDQVQLKVVVGPACCGYPSSCSSPGQPTGLFPRAPHLPGPPTPGQRRSSTCRHRTLPISFSPFASRLSMA